MFSLQQTCAARAASFKLASTSSTTKRIATMLKAVVEPKEENGSIDEEEKVSSSVADAVQSAEKAFEMADATPAVETSSPKAMQAMM